MSVCVHYIISRTCIRRQCDRVKKQHLPAKTTCSRPFKDMAAVARTKLNDIINNTILLCTYYWCTTRIPAYLQVNCHYIVRFNIHVTSRRGD